MDSKLHNAVRYGQAENVLQALKEMHDPNEMGLLNWSPVHEAAHNGERDILKLLLLYNGDVNLPDGLHGNTPLHYAAQEDNSACVTVLLKAGSRLDIKNDDGFNAFDVATPSCLERIEDFVKSQRPVDTEVTQEDCLSSNKPTMNGLPTSNEAWEGLEDVPPQAEIGHLHLSFEFHNATLKIRVWQVSDLLLPPPQTSMIESIFVRSYLIPDPRKKSNRRTEDVRVDGEANGQASIKAFSPQDGIQHIFTPSSFRFNKPLIYTSVNAEILSQRSIQLEVCMVQKQSRKPFLMSMLHMPLRTAVRRPIREKYPLIPCMNYTIPNNMRVYSARDLVIEGSFQYPLTFSRSNSSQSDRNLEATSQHDRLEEVSVEKLVKKFISVDLSDHSDTYNDVDDGIGSLEVKICSGKGSSTSSVTVDVASASSDDDDSNEGLSEVVSHMPLQNASVVLDMNRADTVMKKKKIIPNELLQRKDREKVTNFEMTSSTVVNLEKELPNTVVDIRDLQKDVVLDLEDSVKGGDGNNENSRQVQESGTAYRKKIVPIELLESEDEGEVGVLREQNNNNVSNLLNQTQKCTLAGNDGQIEISSHDNKSNSSVRHKSKSNHHTVPVMEDPDDNISGEIVASKLSCTSEEFTEFPKATRSASRPETPIWDYYDFAYEDKEKGKNENHENENDSAKGEKEPSQLVISDSSESSHATTSDGTLQDSLSQLGCKQPVLDTCRVAGPVLPAIVTEDFDLEEEA